MSRSRRIGLRERLTSPAALVGQGFVVGGAIFFATHDVPLAAAVPAHPPAEAAVGLR